jgi:hypothetical protein
MNQTRHDPIERLNDHHRDDLLAVARTFAGYPTATRARAMRVDARGVDLEVDHREGTATAYVAFPEPADGTPRSVRGAFHRLATEAKTVLANSIKDDHAHE